MMRREPVWKINISFHRSEVERSLFTGKNKQQRKTHVKCWIWHVEKEKQKSPSSIRCSWILWSWSSCVAVAKVRRRWISTNPFYALFILGVYHHEMMKEMYENAFLKAVDDDKSISHNQLIQWFSFVVWNYSFSELSLLKKIPSLARYMKGARK